jgi:exonuclease III
MSINNGLKILQWNPNGFYSKLDEINLLLNKYCPISICLQETNFINDKVCSLKNYTTYYKNRTNAGRASGGVAIYVNSNYHSEEIIINTNLEVVAVNVLIKNSITICNLYLPNSQNFEQSDIQNIINQLPSPYILLGDYNSHSPLWGCSTLDSRGTKIEQTLYSNNDLNILNSGQATRVSASTGHFSAIDLSFSSATITPYIDWDVIPELSSSDHFPIIMTLNHTNSHNHYTRKKKWKLKNVDWNIYQTEIDKNIDSTLWTYTNNVEDKIKLFTDLIMNTASDVFELTSYSGKRPPVPWWNKTIKQAIRKKKSAFNRYKRTLDLQDFIQFKKNKALVRYLIKIEKKN